MRRFLILNLLPASVRDDWRKNPADKRRAAEDKMEREWRDWTGRHRKMFVDLGAGVGKTKRVTEWGISEGRNDIMLYSVVSAESHGAAAQSFLGHPHLQIAQSSIEVIDLYAHAVG